MSSNGSPTATGMYSPWWYGSYRVRQFFAQFSKRAIYRRLAMWACRFIVWQDDGNYGHHARREFLAAGYDPKEASGPNRWIQDNVLELLAVLSLQGHSGGSIGYCVRTFSKLGLFEPLVPLQGTEDEWQECFGGSWQNTRCSHVFKDADGKAYDIDGRIFREPDGCTFTNRDSRVYIDFPYTPKREYVDVPKSE